MYRATFAAVAATTLAHHEKDVAFALIYLSESNGKFARLAAHPRRVAPGAGDR